MPNHCDLFWAWAELLGGVAGAGGGSVCLIWKHIQFESPVCSLQFWIEPGVVMLLLCYLRILVYSVTYDSGSVSLEHLLLPWYPSQRANQP